MINKKNAGYMGVSHYILRFVYSFFIQRHIMENEDGIVLSSYEIPAGEDKNTFSYNSMKNVDYAELKKSEKFTPALYHEKNGIWEGGSISQFSPVMTFKLWEKFSDSCLEVSESMEVNGKRTFGYDEPIVYKRA